MAKNNPFIKPTGPLKGSSTMGSMNDKVARGKSSTTGQKLNSQYFGNPGPENEKANKQIAPAKVKAMAKVMKAYPNTNGAPAPKKVVANNKSGKDGGKSMKYLPR